MQTAPQHPNPSSQSTMVELFSRFFQRLLEKEDKYPIFLKQWESFKSILSNTVLDLDAAFIHLATIQINMQREKDELTALPAPTSTYNIKVERSSTPSGKPVIERRPRPSFTCGPEPRTVAPTFGMLAEEHERSMEFLNNTILSSTTPRTQTTQDELSFLKSPSGESYGQAKFLELFAEAPKSQNQYPLGFVTQKAKELKQHIENNSQTLVEGFDKNNKAEKVAEIAERTPLRRVVMYSRQNSGGDGQVKQQNLLFNALQDLASQLGSDRTRYPFNNALITN